MTNIEGQIKQQNERLTIKDNQTNEIIQVERRQTSVIYAETQQLNEQTQKAAETIDKEEVPKVKDNKEIINNIKNEEDSCAKCPLRCLVFIPICFGYSFLSLFDLITYLIVPLFYCLFYSCSFICTSCCNVISSYQVEEEVGFSGAFSSENEIKLHINNEGGVFHLKEIVCFSYMSTCVKRYFCFIFVIINHILVPILAGWQKAKTCCLKSKIEELYEERVKQVEDISSYKGYESISPKIDLINI